MTVSASITRDIQTLEPSAIIELFELDGSAFGAGVTRFHAGTNGLRQNLVWNGNTYTAFPVSASGFEWSGQGSLPRPKLQVANVTGAISLLAIQYDDMLGAKITRRRTLAKYLDAVNFTPRRNLLSYTDDFSNALWIKSAVTASVTSIVSPLGGVFAQKLGETSAVSGRNIRQWGSIISGLAYTLSFYVKADDRSCVQVRPVEGFSGWAALAYQNFDLATGALAAGSGGRTATITNVGNQWFRITYTDTANATGLGRFQLGMTDSPSAARNPIYTPIVGYGVLLAGGQMEQSSVATDYQSIPTSWFNSPDPTAAFPDEIYTIDRKVLETRDLVEFELAAAFDVAGVQLPRRQIIQNVCVWKYRSAECGYTGTTYFDANDASVASAGQDVCGKRLSSCKARFGAYATLPYGSFPSAGLIK